jgi:hypothetical protein
MGYFLNRKQLLTCGIGTNYDGKIVITDIQKLRIIKIINKMNIDSVIFSVPECDCYYCGIHIDSCGGDNFDPDILYALLKRIYRSKNILRVDTHLGKNYKYNIAPSKNIQFINHRPVTHKINIIDVLDKKCDVQYVFKYIYFDVSKYIVSKFL